MLFLPCANSSPREGEPSGIPSPKKSSEVSVIIDPLNKNARLAMISGEAFGKIWRKIMRKFPAPIAFADITKSKFFKRKNSARIIEEREIQLNKSNKNKRLKKLGIMIDDNIMSKNKTGIDDQISINLCIKISTFPPKKP